MDIEYEAKFLNVNKDELRSKLRSVGAKMVKSERLYKRAVFFLPKGHEIEGGWLRVRDEGDKITMSLKASGHNKIDDQKEVMLTVDNYDNARQLLTEIGCVEKAYQETKREVWMLGEVEITIDEWPFLEPYVEVEGSSEKVVKQVATCLGFDYSQAIFGAAGHVISLKYGLPASAVNDDIKRLVFEGENPYIQWIKEHQI